MTDTQYKAMSLADLGEKQLVELILSEMTLPGCVVGGRGNDATAIDLGIGSLLAVSVDRCPTPLAYKIDPNNLGVWGELAITCVASDLLASGAHPAAFVMSILSPRSMSVSGVLDLVKAAEAKAKGLGAEIVAGDTKESLQLNVITFGIGTLANRHIPRVGAKAGDVLVLTGQIGNFTAAHIAHHHGVSLTDLEATLTNSVLHPKPAFEIANWLLQEIIPKSGMDLSDGLLSTIFRLSKLNDLGFVLVESALPISDSAIHLARRFSIPPLRLAFGTGDWQIAYVVDREEWKRLSNKSAVGSHAYEVGEFTAEPGVWLRTAEGAIRELLLFEQEHFMRSSSDTDFLKCLLEAPLFR